MFKLFLVSFLFLANLQENAYSATQNKQTKKSIKTTKITSNSQASSNVIKEKSRVQDASNSYSAFIDLVKAGFANSYGDKVAGDGRIIAYDEKGNEFVFYDELVKNYLNMATDRFNYGDYVDAYFFKSKAERIRIHRLVAPANPYSFGILPQDMRQFILAREQLRSVSIMDAVPSNDGIVMVDAYLAYDCWLEAFESGNSNTRMQRCKSRFLDDIKALRLSLLQQGYNIPEITIKDDVVLNSRVSTCKSCELYERGYYCNTLYFNPTETTLLSKMAIVIKRLQAKISMFSDSNIDILYYPTAYEYQKKLGENRVDAVKNLIQNQIVVNNPIKPSVSVHTIKLSREEQTQKIFRDAITVCVSGGE